ncbi:MAG: 30S ribosomal protein S4 [Candidatus Bathyarchaeota archaeon]|nr:MAG: 30S ribosomal protein S4 [Candidatus Bathyarchaeota archaeon]
MGDPKKQRKKYDPPRFPWRTDVLQGELRLLGQYGLRNKRELWRHKTMLSKFRGSARSTLGMSEEEGKKMKIQLLNRLNRLGILPETAGLDDVLDLAIEDILERRLQSLVFNKGLAKSVYQARQLITHGHIAIGKKRVTAPSYLVPRLEEAHIEYSPSSTIANSDHPLRQTLISLPPKTKTIENATEEGARS